MAEQLELFPEEELQQQDAGSIGVPETKPIADAEWCFQFFNNEPIVFAWSNEGEEPAPLVLQIEPETGEGLNFQHNGMVFKIFPREISEETKVIRTEQNGTDTNESKD
jgi:hypothetical protein